jgi:hypothetical protein
MCKFAQAISAQARHSKRSAGWESAITRRFPFGVPDDVVKSVLKLLEETTMRKTEIARQHNLTPSSVYNIKNRYTVLADGSVDRMNRNDNPNRKNKKC